MAKVALRVLSISVTVLFCVLVICGLYRLGLKCYDFGYRVYTEPAVTQGDGEDKLVQVTEGMSTKELAEVLEEKGLVRDAKLFYVQAKLEGFQLTAGSYRLNTSMTAREMMEAMSASEEDEGDTLEE
jgi:UPF0755 protein